LTTFAGFAVGGELGACDGLARATDAEGSTVLADGSTALDEADAWALGTELGAVGVFSTFAEQAARPETTATAAMIATPRDAGCMIAVDDTRRSRGPFP
jgi:hypothetical protein